MTAPGVINLSELYTLREAKHRLRLGRYSFLKLRLAGLRELRVGRSIFVLGADLITTIESLAAQQKEGQQ
jgi:hypothetical protein